MEYNISMSFFSFLKRNKESYSLVFNIGSGSVSGGIIKFTEKAGVDIMYYAKENIPFQKEISIPKHLELMKAALTLLTQNIQAEGLKKIPVKKDKKIHIDRVFYIFSSPWSISQTKVVRIKELKSLKITDSYLNKVVDEQAHLFETELARAGQIIEKKITQIKANGYIINDPTNISAHDLELSVFFTIVPEDILQAVEKSVSQVFEIKNVWCHSLSLPILSVIRDLFPQKEDFIHIDISEEITDIATIKNNVMTNSLSIPLGRNYFIRELSKAMNVSEGIADSMIKLHCAKANDELAALKLSVAMDTVSKNWLTEVNNILKNCQDKMYVTELIFLVANSDLSFFLKDKLSKQSYEVVLLDNKSLKSSLVKGDLVFKLILMFLDNLYKI